MQNLRDHVMQLARPSLSSSSGQKPAFRRAQSKYTWSISSKIMENHTESYATASWGENWDLKNRAGLSEEHSALAFFQSRNQGCDFWALVPNPFIRSFSAYLLYIIIIIIIIIIIYYTVQWSAMYKAFQSLMFLLHGLVQYCTTTLRTRSKLEQFPQVAFGGQT